MIFKDKYNCSRAEIWWHIAATVGCTVDMKKIGLSKVILLILTILLPEYKRSIFKHKNGVVAHFEAKL